MMKDPICCEPRRDVFLAVTEIMPFEPEVHRRTSEQLKRSRERLIDALHNYEHIIFDLFDENSIVEAKSPTELINQNEQDEQEQQNNEREPKISLNM